MSEADEADASSDAAQPRKLGAPVRVMPRNLEFHVLEGETLMAAARRAGLRWPNVCDGQGSCTVCYVKIESGIESANTEMAWERERLNFAGRRESSFRLACQLKISGPMVVTKVGVKRPE